MAKKSEKVVKIKYSKVVAEIVDGGYYYKDAMDWYCLKYLNAVAERTFFILLSVMSLIIVMFLYYTIKNMLPLKEEFPVLTKQSDAVNYYTTIQKIKPDTPNYNSNEAILRFLLINYVRTLFTHNYRSGNIEDLNNKLTKVKNYSTDEVFQRYRETFNKISADMFNKQVDQNIVVKSFRFAVKKDAKRSKKMLDYLFTKIPTEAEITYTTVFNNYGESKKDVSNERISLSYKFEPIKYSGIKKEFTKPVLVITDYKIIKEGEQ
ncbi:MAG: hypothetical protein LBS34_03225 [Rickettsiales bacterium]|jgi:type IV secretion system protein VirB8|nr:hypothetical protein [Rickettsiales bacterium]